MGLDMYILSYPRYKGEYVESKIIGEWEHYISNADYQFGVIPTYDQWDMTPPFSRECYDFYASKYVRHNEQPKEWEYTYNNGIYTEVQYWRKAYTLSEFLNKYYDDIENDWCSRELKREDIIAFQQFITDKLTESISMKKGQIVGYVDSKNKYHFFKNVKALLVDFDNEDDTAKIPIQQPLYTELPIEFIAEDDWELSRLLEGKEMCKKILEEFDFENNVLVYYASY